MAQRDRQLPISWNVYERGRASSFGSLDSVPEDQQQVAYSPTQEGPSTQHDGTPERVLRGRRSSLGVRIDSLRRMGGINNIDNFAKSWQRAAKFHDITPVPRGSISMQNDEEEDEGPIFEGSQQSTPTQAKSLIKQRLEAAGGSAIEDSNESVRAASLARADERTQLLPPSDTAMNSMRSYSVRSHTPSVSARLRHRVSHASISSKLTVAAQRRASILIEQQREATIRALEDPEEAKDIGPAHTETEVLPDGEVVERIVGESTVPMTIFNSTNVLIGVGILALPLGIRYSGWVIGIVFLTLAAIITSYTARLLAKCLDTNTGATTYGDLAFLAFDNTGRAFVETLFILELTAANVALVILFADSMNSLVPSVSVNAWKLLIALGLMPLNFAPFKWLSVTSILGIMCCFGTIAIVFIDGLINTIPAPEAGSLRHPAKTYAFPTKWSTVPLSLGLFMAPWGGHSVFPAIYKDMRHPKKYGRAVKYTYIATYGLDFSMAVLGYLMFGDYVRDEVTSNILKSTTYPRALSVILVVLIAIIPITKIPLSNRPIMDTINKKFYIDLRQMDPKARQASERSWTHRLARGSIAVACNLVQLGVSIGFPDFDSIMALMGSALCFLICVILPVSFYLRIFSSEGKEISLRERILDWFLLVICAAGAIVGTVSAVMPKDKIGADMVSVNKLF